MQPHIEEDLLDQYAIGNLSAELISPVEDHLLECTVCQQRLVETDEFVGTFRSAITQLESPVPFWKRMPRLLVMRAAAVAVPLVLLAVGLQQVSDRNQSLPATMVLMQSLRGPDAGARIPAQKPAVLMFDMPVPAPPEDCRMEIVDLKGTKVLETAVALKDGRLAASLQGLARGGYWVRLYSRADNELLAEFSLHSD